MVWMNCLVGLARTPSRKELRTCVPPATVPFRRVRSISRASRSWCWCMRPECTRRSGSLSTVSCPRARCRITRAARLKSGFFSSGTCRLHFFSSCKMRWASWSAANFSSRLII